MSQAETPLLVVSNTTPISNLIQLRQLSLLGRLYGRVLIPEQVAAELVRGQHVLGDWREAAGAGDIEVVAPLDGPLLRQLKTTLDDGEAAAICLALERDADLLLIDERDGRQVAATHQVPLSGTLGVLLDAKQAGHLAVIRPLLDDLAVIGFHISASLREHVLRLAGER
jgi:hypothetical protein